MEILGYVGALFIGLVLGLTGGGGSILTVPILVYLMSISPVTATAYSLFIVGTLIWNYQSENDTLNQDNTNSIVSDDAKIKTNNNANSGIENSAITSSESNE